VDERDIRQFADSTAVDETVDLASQDAITDLQAMVKDIQTNKTTLKDALQDIIAKVKAEFPEATFGIVYNLDPNEKWELDIYINLDRRRAVMNFVWPLVRAHPDLGIYPDVPRLENEEDEMVGESARDAV